MSLLRQSGFGYEFDASKCERCGGKCCTGESGYIWISSAEISSLAEHLKMSEGEFRSKFLDKFGYKFSLKEKPYEGGFACVFFDETAKNCSVYDFRPSQCRTFPFWDYFKDKINELEKECAGIRRF